MKKILSIMLSVLVFVSCFSITANAFAEENEKTGQTATFNWELKAGVLSINSKNVEVNRSLVIDDDLKTEWKKFESDITSVVIGEGFDGISNKAFNGFEQLLDVTVFTPLKSIGNEAFSGCISLENLNIVSSDTISIGEQAFENCDSLRDVAINNVTDIGKGAFENCDCLSNVALNGDYKAIPTSAFYHNANLSSVKLADSVVKIGANAFAFCSNLKDINMPNSLVEIGSSAFQDTAVECVALPNTLKFVGNCAFSDSSLTSIDINDGVEFIGSYAFANTNIANLKIPNGVTKICKGICSYCDKLITVSIGNNTETIEENAFLRCVSLKSISIPKSVQTIGQCAFDNTASLKSVVFENGIREIGMQAFFNSAITSVVIPSTVEKIGEYAFFGCDIKKAQIGAKVLEKGAFANNRLLSSLTLAETVKSIGDYAFENNLSLKKVSIPSSVEFVGTNAFDNNVIIEADDYSTGSAYAKKNENKFYSRHTHDYSVVTTQATCCKDGKIVYKCKNCDYSYTKKLPKNPKSHKKFVTKTVKATTTKNGCVKVVCSECGYIKSKKVIKKIATVSLSRKSFKYNGKTHKPSVVVKDSSGNVISSKNYTLKYSGSGKKIGSYTVTVVFKNNYSGKITRNFTVKK